ncbi:unnamed protein product [Periconia digitata]|uniref:Proline dehydrogenase n=1 Tax=Periconia digitata TaxID=1303443 RepID=A0A9W4UAX3_9PLEO|nr:unnamed protein product [Periconia digitata]
MFLSPFRPVSSRTGSINSLKVICFQVRSNTSVTSLPKTPASKNGASQVETTKPGATMPSTFSSMPTGMLVRSLFISGISSNRYLLIPALRLLSFLSKPDRSYLFNVDRNIFLHSILKKTVYDQFCAGETLEETNACVQKFKKLGFKGFILTYAKEVVLDQKTKDASGLEEGVDIAIETKVSDKKDKYIENWRTGTLQTMDQVGQGDILAIKISGAGPSVTKDLANGKLPSAEMFAALDELASQAKTRGIRIIVDAESQHFQAAIAATALELMRKYNRGNEALIYNTYQAYLKSTPSVVQYHLSEAEKGGFTLGLKVVRGAYILSEQRSLIHDTKHDTDDAYNSIVQGALRRQYSGFGTAARPFPSLNLLVASHNRDSVLAAHRLHQDRVKAGLATVPVIYAQLHGMSDEVSFSLLRENGEDGSPPAVYKCSTWGTMGECVGYLLRRAVENRDAVLRTKDEFLALRKEMARRIRARIHF